MERADSQDQLFSNLWKSFLGMYQIFTGEDWTKYLYTVTQNDSGQKMGWIGASFIIGWFTLSSIVILNMFLSRIDDSLNLPEDQKRLLQVKNFLRERSNSFFNDNIIGYTSVLKEAAPPPSILDASTEGSIAISIDAFLGDDVVTKTYARSLIHAPNTKERYGPEFWFHSALTKVGIIWETTSPKHWAQRSSVISCRVAKIYAKSKKVCQILLNQDQHISTSRHFTLKDSFTIFINMSIVTQVLITCVTTPLYQREYFNYHGYTIRNWFSFVDFGFALLWSIEGVMKIIAGGLVIGPHAYLRGWNLIDATVLVSAWVWLALLWYNVRGSAAALVASFKAFRALRLLTLNKKMMREINLVFSRGRYRLFASILVSLSLLTPFAVLGVNLFVNRSKSCNDPSILHHIDCVGEFLISADSSYLTPRVVSRPYYSFDNFGQSFYTLFLIVSQEGWTDVMDWARTIPIDSLRPVGPETLHSASDFNSFMNALFFVVFNFCGTIFVTALFASVMIHNYTEATGVAYLTFGQKAWTEQKRLLRRIRPSRRPAEPEKLVRWKKQCYNLATRKEGVWPKMIIATLVVYMVILCVDFYPADKDWSSTRGKTRTLQLEFPGSTKP
jgi:hypothetical protein